MAAFKHQPNQTLSNSGLYQFAQLGQVAASFFHDAANIITSLKLDIELLNNDSLSKARANVVSHRLAATLLSLEELIDATRAPITMRKNEEVEVSVLIDEVVTLLRPLAQRQQIKLEVVLPAEPVIISTSKVALFQVLLNILTNAVEAYLPDASSYPFKVVELTLQSQPTVVRIQIQDWGKGMTEQQLTKLYKPFTSTKQSSPKQGRGLGLYLTQQQVRTVLQGSLQCESTPNTGTIFTLELPK